MRVPSVLRLITTCKNYLSNSKSVLKFDPPPLLNTNVATTLNFRLQQLLSPSAFDNDCVQFF